MSEEKGKIDLETCNPELAAEWDYEKNGDLTPSLVAVNSSKKVWWRCSNGHEWQASISNRNRGHGCIYCSNQKVLPGYNDLAPFRPDIAREWHPTKNNTLTPQMVSYGSTKKVWWRCINGHDYEATVNNRSTGYGCPYCSGRRSIKGQTDLASINPRIASEWHPTKNLPLTPEDVGAYSHQKVWWQCGLGHEWQAAIYSRLDGNECPVCSKRSHSSFPEQAMYFYIKQVYPDAINGYTAAFSNQMEIDVFIPSISTGIEYDGIKWHNSPTSSRREKKKYEFCKNRNIRLIRLKEIYDSTEDNVNSAADEIIFLNKEPSYLELDRAILSLFHLICSKAIKVDTSADSNEIKAQYYYSLQRKSLASLFPEIASEWHPTKNAPITAEMVSPQSHDIVWWKCSKGHDWRAALYSRVNGNGCPFCGGQKVLAGYNDLETIDPKLTEEWHPTKNLPLTPQQVTVGSKVEVWWRCSKGHEWKTAIKVRRKGIGCPYCANKRVLVGFNDLATLRPDIAAEWHPTLNESITPQMVTVSSGVKAWWKCEYGHEWNTSIAIRSRGSGCPVCAKQNQRKAHLGKLSDSNQELLLEWHPTKNYPLLPSEVTCGSEKKVWWRCNKGHEWIASVKSRSKGTGCPYCANRKVLTGYNDLASINPELAKEWHPTKNLPLTPQMVGANSNIKVWWLCENGHTWEAKIDSRNKGTKCPLCTKNPHNKR